VDEDKVLKQGVASAMSIKPFRHIWVAFSSITSMISPHLQVYIEAEAHYRANTQNLSQFYVRNNQGQNVPLSSLANFETELRPEFTLRYNEYRAAQIFGSAAPGYSSQQATAALEDVFHSNHAPRNGLRLHGYVLSGAKSAAGCASLAIFALSNFSSFF